MSKLTLRGSNIEFFNDKNDTSPAMILTQGDSIQDGANITLKLPNSLPSDDNNNILAVNSSSGQMQYASIGEQTI